MRNRNRMFGLLFGLSVGLLLCAEAAAVSCMKGEDIMGSPYLQPFDIAFAGAAPPIQPGSSINDEFRNQAPMVGNFVGLDPKWQIFNPGTNLGISVVDQLRQMAYLATIAELPSGQKQWCGVFQDLPQPDVGATLQYQVYIRSLVGYLPASNFTDQCQGLLIGVDMAGAPTTTDLWSVHSNVVRTLGAVEASIQSAEFASYDAPLAPEGSIEGQLMEWLRARIVTQRTGPGPADYDNEIYFDASANGVGWIGVTQFTGITQPLRHVGLGLRPTDGQFFVSYFDFLRYYQVALVAGETLTTGGLQYLGAV